MTSAETTPPTGGEAQAPAPGAELSIPKHRYDEVAAELRRVREAEAMKDRLYMEERNRWLAQQQQTQPQIPDSPDEYGLDPQTFNGVKKLAAKMAEGIISQQKQVFEQQIGILANRTEKAEFLAMKGSDKAKYMPRIQEEQQKHYQATGTYMSAEIAFELIRAKENEARIAQLEARLAGQAPATTPEQQPQVLPPQQGSHGGVPSAAGTRQLPSGGAPQAQSPSGTEFGNLSLEEMEARLEQEFRGGTRL